MKTTLNAIEKTLPDGIEPIVMARSGFLRAIVCKSEDECRFTICREDPNVGAIETSFTPSDVESLARLTAMVANAFHMILAGELGDDLGCLAHCISSSLELEFDEEGRPQRAANMQ